MRTQILFFASLFVANASYAQNFDRRNSIMMESNFIASLSLSYDRILPMGEKTAIMFGGDYIMGVGFGTGSHWLTPEISLIAFGPRHFLETGAQYLFEVGQHDGDPENSPGLRLAYRFQGNKGITLRATVNIFFNIDPLVVPTIGMGYSF